MNDYERQLLGLEPEPPPKRKHVKPPPPDITLVVPPLQDMHPLAGLVHRTLRSWVEQGLVLVVEHEKQKTLDPEYEAPPSAWHLEAEARLEQINEDDRRERIRAFIERDEQYAKLPPNTLFKPIQGHGLCWVGPPLGQYDYDDHPNAFQNSWDNNRRLYEDNWGWWEDFEVTRACGTPSPLGCEQSTPEV